MKRFSDHNTRREAVKVARKHFEADAKKFLAGKKRMVRIKVSQIR